MRCFVGTDERGKRKSGTGDTIDKITKINFKKCSLLASRFVWSFRIPKIAPKTKLSSCNKVLISSEFLCCRLFNMVTSVNTK